MNKQGSYPFIGGMETELEQGFFDNTIGIHPGAQVQELPGTGIFFCLLHPRNHSAMDAADERILIITGVHRQAASRELKVFTRIAEK